MKKLSFILFLLTMLAASSCVSKKKIVYFQGADTVYANPQKILQEFDMRIKPADNITIKVSSSNPELLEIFANAIILGTSRTTNMGNLSNAGGSLGNIYSYTVNNNGDLVLPQLGKIHLGGLTTEEAANAISEKIREMKYINDPEVTVRFTNARVTVIGGVGRSNVVNLTSERNTIVDVLAQCGDIADDGLKKNIKLFREVNGERTMYNVDLTSVDVFNSPAYYVQQNDLIYVEPNKSKRIKNSACYTFLSAGASLLGVTSTVLSLIVLLKKW